MKRLINYDCKLISREEFEDLESMEEVASIENNGSSGKYIGATWYTVNLKNGEEINVYFFPEEI